MGKIHKPMEKTHKPMEKTHKPMEKIHKPIEKVCKHIDSKFHIITNTNFSAKGWILQSFFKTTLLSFLF